MQLCFPFDKDVINGDTLLSSRVLYRSGFLDSPQILAEMGWLLSIYLIAREVPLIHLKADKRYS